MTQRTIQDWTTTQVHLNYGAQKDVKYKVFKQGDKIFQEICDIDGTPIHRFELPDGLAMERSSYEVMLRYVLADVVNS